MSSRWIGWHLFSLFLVVVLVGAGVWQWDVAMSSVGPDGESNVNIRNLVYAMQWWVFAIFGMWFWLRFLRDQRDADLEEMLANSQEASVREDVAGSHAAQVPTETDERISLDQSATVRRERSRSTLGQGAREASEADHAGAQSSDSVPSSDSPTAREGS
jgi:hypothetical protein